MSAFGLEMEQGRVEEAIRAGLNQDHINQSVEDQLRSLLAERTETVNPFTLAIDGSDVTARGFEHRGDLDNTYALSIKDAADEQRAERFRLENQGYENVKEKFFTLPVHSTVVLMSPPPEVPIDGYPGYNLMYFYHILPGEKDGQRTIKALSFINRFSKDEQAEILNRINPGLNVFSTEESILLSPAEVESESDDAGSFRDIWKIVEEVYGRSERDFTSMPVELAERFLLEGEDLWKDRNRTLDVMVAEVASLIAQGFTSAQIKDEWAIMFNLADRDLLHQDFTNGTHYEVPQDSLTAAIVFEQFSHLAEEEVRRVATSCGNSGGIDSLFNSLAAIENTALRNSLNPLAGLNGESPIKTTTFTAEEAKDDPNLCRCGDQSPHFHCGGKTEPGGECRQEIFVGRGIDECPSCGNGAVCKN